MIFLTFSCIATFQKHCKICPRCLKIKVCGTREMFSILLLMTLCPTSTPSNPRSNTMMFHHYAGLPETEARCHAASSQPSRMDEKLLSSSCFISQSVLEEVRDGENWADKPGQYMLHEQCTTGLIHVWQVGGRKNLAPPFLMMKCMHLETVLTEIQ